MTLARGRPDTDRRFEIVSDATTGEIVLSLQTMTLRLGNGTETFVTLTLDGVILVARGEWPPT